MKRALVAVLTLATLAASVPVSASAAPRRPAGTTVGRVTLTDIAPLSVGQQQHSAFPGMAKMSDGKIHLVYRLGSDHSAARDGNIMRATSADGGLTFGNPQKLRTGGDHRDPSISYARGMGWLSWFAGSAANPAIGAYVQREWGPTIRIDGGLTRAAMTAPVVELPNGQVGAVFYGRKNGDTIDTCWMAWSSDDGRTWTTNRITNQIGAGRHTNEPYAVVSGDLVHVFYRWGTASGIGMRSFTDSGHVAQTPERQILSNASGRPTVLRMSDGALVMVYRELPSEAARITTSRDDGATWQDGGVLLDPPAGSPNGMTYATMVETAPGVVRGVVGMEETLSVSKLYGFGLVVTG
jgi:hypothetical protein